MSLVIGVSIRWSTYGRGNQIEYDKRRVWEMSEKSDLSRRRRGGGQFKIGRKFTN